MKGKKTDPKKIKALVKMLMPKTPHIYKCFIKIFAYVMALITKLLKKVEVFKWITKCQTIWEDIKNMYIQAPLLIIPNWELEFHVHIEAIGAILAQNPIGKIDQLVMYSSKLFNSTRKNYTTAKIKALTMVYTLHKFRHYILGNKITFFMDHMALVYLVKKPQVFMKLARWLLLFLEYDFKIVYKPNKSHLMAYAFNRLPNH
jgi:hypothetical protein